MQIRFVSYRNIDRRKWDDCIARVADAKIYSSSIWLDAMAGEWDALVADDYRIIMPIISRRKYFVRYTYQPPFLQKTGIYSASPISVREQNGFLDKLIATFRFGEISVDVDPGIIADNDSAIVTSRNNFAIDLRNDYSALSDHYSEHFVTNLKRAAAGSFSYELSGVWETVFELYFSLYSSRFDYRTTAAKTNLKKVFKTFAEKNDLLCRQVNSEKNLLAAVLFIRFKDRFYNLISITTAKGRVSEANRFLFDNVFREFAGTSYILDLEGSSIPGVADFYRRLGAVNEPYAALRWNRLPRPLTIFKK